MSLPSCKTCTGFEEDIQELIDDRVRYAVAPVRVDRVACSSCGPDPGPFWYVNAWVFSRPVGILDTRGRRVHFQNQSSHDGLNFEVQWRDGAWKAARIRVIRQP